MNKTTTYKAGENDIDDIDFTSDVPKDEILYARLRHNGSAGQSGWSAVIDFIVGGPWSIVEINEPFKCNDYRAGTVDVVALSPTTALICFTYGDNEYMAAQVLVLSGTSISVGAIRQYTSKRFRGMSTTVLSNSKAMVCFQDLDYYYLYSIILSISGTTVTVGSLRQVTSGNSSYISVGTLTASKAIVAYKDSNGSISANVLSVSGTSITAGAVRRVNTNTSFDTSLSVLASDKAIVCFRDYDQGSSVVAYVLSAPSTTITVGSARKCNSLSCNFISVAALSATKAIVVFQNASALSYLYAQVLTISGTSITAGGAVQCNSTNSSYTSVIFSTTTKGMASYRGAGGYLYAQVLAISGTTIIPGDAIQYNNMSSYRIAVATLPPEISGEVSSKAISACLGTNFAVYAQVLVG